MVGCKSFGSVSDLICDVSLNVKFYISLPRNCLYCVESVMSGDMLYQNALSGLQKPVHLVFMYSNVNLKPGYTFKKF